MKSILKNLSRRELVILFLVSFVGIGAVFYVFEYEVQMKRIGNLKAQQTDLQMELASYRQAVAGLRPQEVAGKIQTAGNAVLTLQEEIAFLKSRMSGKPRDVLRLLSLQAQQYQAQLKSVDTVEKPVTRGQLRYRQVSIQLNLVSSYRALGAFLRSLDNIPALLTIRDMSINRNPDLLPWVESKVTIQLFVL